MKKIIIAVCTIVSLHSSLVAQVLNTASTLKPGAFSLTVAPVLFVERDNDLGLDFGAGVGVGHGVDLAFKMLIQPGKNYFGGDVEFMLLNDVPQISLAFGAHAWNDVGLDGTLNITFPIRHVLSLYTGLDFDAEFYHGGQAFPLWVPVGMEVKVRRHLGIVMEIDVAADHAADSRFSAGMNVYF